MEEGGEEVFGLAQRLTLHGPWQWNKTQAGVPVSRRLTGGG